jgi:hypothetical protein
MDMMTGKDAMAHGFAKHNAAWWEMGISEYWVR